MAGFTLRDKVRSSDICVERSQLRWLGHLIRMPPGSLLFEVFLACTTGRRPRGRPRTCWRDYIIHLAWECLGIPQEELEDSAQERDIWSSLLTPLPLRYDPDNRRENGWIDGWNVLSSKYKKNFIWSFRSRHSNHWTYLVKLSILMPPKV